MAGRQKQRRHNNSRDRFGNLSVANTKDTIQASSTGAQAHDGRVQKYTHWRDFTHTKRKPRVNDYANLKQRCG